MNLTELQNKIYQQNKSIGWWDEPRSFSTFACLFHSELSEAMEGLRKGLMDDHLPEYPMFHVELADFVIRCLDWLGSVGFDGGYHISIAGFNDSEIDCLAFLHQLVSQSAASNVEAQRCSYLYAGVVGAINFSESKGFDLLKIINEKIEYNKNRADHKRENREKSGGKKF